MKPYRLQTDGTTKSTPGIQPVAVGPLRQVSLDGRKPAAVAGECPAARCTFRGESATTCSRAWKSPCGRCLPPLASEPGDGLSRHRRCYIGSLGQRSARVVPAC